MKLRYAVLLLILVVAAGAQEIVWSYRLFCSDIEDHRSGSVTMLAQA